MNYFYPHPDYIAATLNKLFNMIISAWRTWRLLQQWTVYTGHLLL